MHKNNQVTPWTTDIAIFRFKVEECHISFVRMKIMVARDISILIDLIYKIIDRTLMIFQFLIDP